ncbi:MAG: hypothetical protein K9W44_00970 [Candidatus Lokiarchaeota archaeon]|nr:hypothetical protein [Candidatus Harpocratesius repetitus]
MSKIGSFSERELGDKLQNVSIEEMQEFHKKRMKKYRIFTILAVLWAVLCSVSFFVFPNYRLYTGVGAIVGLIFISYTKYEQNRWIRLFENLVYFKNKREKIYKDEEQRKHPYTDKYRRVSLQKKKNEKK